MYIFSICVYVHTDDVVLDVAEYTFHQLVVVVASQCQSSWRTTHRPVAAAA